jgi:hypothetical protein
VKDQLRGEAFDQRKRTVMGTSVAVRDDDHVDVTVRG